MRACVLLIMIAQSIAGCGSPCVVGTSRCVGSTLQTCESMGNDGPFARTVGWWSSECDGACVDSGAGAFCAKNSAPDPECEGRDGTICFQGGTATCAQGHITIATACPDGRTCVDSAACGAICVPDPTPDPRCGTAPRGASSAENSYCDGATAVACSCGYVAWRSSCGSPDLCLAIGSEASCVASPVRFPQCDDAHEYTGFCNGNSVVSCWWGYLLGESSCGTGTCTPTATGAGCTYSFPGQ